MATITQYLMPFGAFENTDKMEEGEYSRKFDQVDAYIQKLDIKGIDLLAPGSKDESYIKMTLQDGLFIFTHSFNRDTQSKDYYAIYIRPKTSGFEFFRAIADFAAIEEVPKDMKKLRFDFGKIVLNIDPHQYNKHDRFNTVEIYVPECNLGIHLDNMLWGYLKDFAKMEVAAESFLKTYGDSRLNLV